MDYYSYEELSIRHGVLKALFDVKSSVVLFVLTNCTCTPSNTASMKHLAHWCYEMNCIVLRSTSNKGLFF
jgi:hypothetical protein